jgi:hypothetical protein
MEAQRLLIRGMRPRQVMLALIESEHVSEPTARRYVDVAEAEIYRRRRRRDKGLDLALAAERAEETMAMALEAKKIVPGKNGAEVHDDPNLAIHLAAQQHLAKLRGLYAPEKHEVYVANFARAMQMLVQLIAREVEDVALRGRLILGIRGIFEDAPKAKAIGVTVSRETVIDATIVPRETTNGSA